MQTIQFNSIINPTRFPSPSTISESHKFSQPPPAKTPRAVSTSTPDHNNKNITTSSTLGLDDSTSAYWDYQFLFVSQRSETAAPISLRVVDGAIPPEFPSGTYYLTGPGMFTDDHGSTVHPLDGHGYLRAFEFDMGTTGEVKFMAKYVRTEAQVEEHDPRTDTWRFTHRGPFSVLKGGKKFGNTKVMKNVANTSVLKWGGKLLCLWEGGDPYEIESGTLDTIGRFEVIDGRDYFPDGRKRKSNDRWDVAAEMLKPILYGVFKMPPKRLLSHYKLDTRRNRLLTVSCKAEDMLLPRSNFTFYEFDSNFKLLQKQDFDIPDHLMIHDWAFTDTHYILFGNRIKLDVLGSVSAVCGLSAMISALTVNPSKPTSSIYLIPRFPTESVEVRDWRVPVEAPSQMWLLHVANAYEIKDFAGNSHIQIHACSCSYQWFNFQNLFGYNWHSGRLDPSSMNVKESEYELLPQLVQVVEEQSFSITSKREEKCMNELETRVQDLEKKNYELEERLSTLQNENQIHRHTTVSINLDANGNCQECSVEPLNQLKKSSDFPIINPTFSGKKNTCIYAAASSGSRRTLPHFPFDTVLKLNVLTKSVATWTVGARRFIGEPIFVPKGVEEDDGYLLVIEYAVSIQRCFLVILDPKRIGQADALVARLEVPRDFNFPLGFHGFWAEQN